MWQNQADFLSMLGQAVFSGLWQMGLLWLVYRLAVIFLPPSRSAARGGLATFLLMTGFAWFVFTLITSSHTGTQDPLDARNLLSPVMPVAAKQDLLYGLFPILAGIYILFLTPAVIRLIGSYRKVQRLKYEGLTRMPVEWRLFVRQWASRLGIAREVSIWISDRVLSPATIGFLKPVILLPLAALSQLSTAQLEAVLLHELAHIRRHDYLLNLMVQVVRTVLYYNPFVRLFTHEIEKQRELDCDQLVMQFRYDATEYAGALLLLQQQQLADRFRLPLAGNRSLLLSRIEHMLGVGKRNTRSALAFGFVLLAFTGLLTLGSLLSGEPQKQVLASAISNKEPYSPLADYTPTGKVRPVLARAKKISPAATTENTDERMEEPAYPDNLGSNPIIPAAQRNISIPLLNAEQEMQVKKAMEESRKVLENIEWKKLETNIAEVLSQREKEQVKKKLSLELNRQNWEQWENQMRVLYDQVNWEQINGQLETALQQVRKDSLVNVYNKAMSHLDMLKNQLNGASVQGIPDTDLSLKNIDAARATLMEQLRNLLRKPRKIVKL